MEEPRSKRNVTRFRQGRKRNVRRREDQPTLHKKKMERSDLKEKEIQLLIAQSNLQPNNQAKLQRKPARSTLALQTDITQANAKERAKRMRRNEEEETYL